MLWNCQTCGKLIKPGMGYLWLHTEELKAAIAWGEEQEKERSKERRPGAPWKVICADDIPEPVIARWKVQHAKCDTQPDEECYWIPVERMTTAVDVLERTVHLMEKTWFHCTNWNSVLRGVAHTMRDMERTRRGKPHG